MKYSLILLAVIFLSSTCKRKDTRPYGPQYEEDPGPERGTVSERLEGNWRIVDYLRNDTSIINLPQVANSGTINIKDVYWEYRRPTEKNDWYETSSIYPWKWYARISNDSITFSGYDTTFCYWFANPLIMSNSTLAKGWKITQLYQSSLHVKSLSANNVYKIYWKK